MKKYILKDGKEVKFGDTIYAKTNFNGFRSVVTATLDEYTVDMLKGLGIIKEIEVCDPFAVGKILNDAFKKEAEIKLKEIADDIDGKELFPILLKSVIQYVANKLEVSFIEAARYLMNLEEVNPASALNIYLKRISLKLNKKYPHTPIRDLDKIYIISMYDGKVTSVCPKDIKNLKHFAWFRDFNDAAFARKCVLGLIERMFGKDDQSEDK